MLKNWSNQEQPREKGSLLTSPLDTRNYLIAQLCNETREIFAVLFL